MNIRTRTRSLILHVVAALVVLTCPALGGEIHDAARNGNLKRVQALINDNPQLVFSRDQYGNTPLHLAANLGHKDVVAFLLANKADVNAKANNGWTPLHSAAQIGEKDIVAVLLANNADVNAKDEDGKTPLRLVEEKIQIVLGPPESVRSLKDVAILLQRRGSQGGPQNTTKGTTAPASRETASTSTAATRTSSVLPFAVKGLVIPPGGSIKTDADEYIKEAAGLRIDALYLGGTEVALKSGTLSPNMLIPTRDYGDVQLKFSLGGGPRFCQIWVTLKQEESFKTLCNKGKCEYPSASSNVKLPSSGAGCALIR